MAQDTSGGESPRSTADASATISRTMSPAGSERPESPAAWPGPQGEQLRLVLTGRGRA